VRRWLPVLTVAGLLTAVAIAFWQRRMVEAVPATHEIPRWSADLYEQYVPVWTYAYQGSRFLPWWNPYQLAGVPFVATFGIGGLLYPASWLATVVRVPLAMGYACAAHIALAGVLTLACGRALGLSWPAAALAGVGFMLDTSFLAERTHPSYLFGLAWIPAVFLVAGRVLVEPHAWSGCLLGVVIALQVLTYPQLACFIGYALFLLLVVHLLVVRPPLAVLRRMAVAGALAVGTATLLAAAQWLPTLELVAHAARGSGGLSLAQIMGDPAPEWHSYILPITFSSGALALLVPWGFSDRRRPMVLALGALLAIFAVLVGFGTPFYTRVFYHFPAVGLFRIPSRILPIGTFAIAMLAGVALDKVVRHEWRRAWARALVITAVAATVLLVWWRAPPSVTLPLAAVAAAGLTAILTWLRVRIAGAWVVVLLVIAERWAQPNYVPIPQADPDAFFAPPPFVQFLRERVGTDRVMVIKDWRNRFPIMEKMGTLYGLRVVQDYEPLTVERYHEFLGDFDDVNIDRPAFGGRFFPRPDHRAWNRLDLLGVRYVVVAPRKRWAAPPDRFRIVYEKQDATIYENTARLPRAFLATVPRREADPKETLRRMSAHDFDPLNEVLVEDEVTWEPAPATNVAVAPQVVFDPGSDDTVVLRVSTPTRAVLVLTDLFWPGWRVTVDGAERRIHRVDYLFRGVAVEPGTHVILFWYDPASVKLGFAISAGAFALLLAAAASRTWRARSPRLAPPSGGAGVATPAGSGA